jgi:hypothetical protein
MMSHSDIPDVVPYCKGKEHLFSQQKLSQDLPNCSSQTLFFYSTAQFASYKWEVFPGLFLIIRYMKKLDPSWYANTMNYFHIPLNSSFHQILTENIQEKLGYW